MLGTLPRIAIVTSRLEPSQTFLVRDLYALTLGACPTLFVLGGRGLPLGVPCPVETLPWLGPVRRRRTTSNPTSGRTSRALRGLLALYARQPQRLALHLAILPGLHAWASQLQAGRFALIHGYWASHAASAACVLSALSGVPYTFGAHAHDLLEPRTALREKAARARGIVVCSESARQRLLPLLPPRAWEKIHLARHGIEIGTHGGSKPARACHEPRTVLSVGRNVPKKGFPILLEAMAHLRRWGYELGLTLCGPGPAGAGPVALARCAARLGLSDRVRCTGWITEEALRDQMADADVYVQPSVQDPVTGDMDGTPNALLEAMACGVPVVASAVGGIPEVTRNDRAGLLVPPGDARALAEAIRRCLDDPLGAQHRAREARLRIERDFDLGRTGGSLRPFLTRFLGEDPGSLRARCPAISAEPSLG